MATLEPIVGGVDSGSDAINKLDRNIKKLNLEIQDIDITDKIKNNLTETVPGNALDAVQGKLLAEQISILTGLGFGTNVKNLGTNVNLNTHELNGRFVCESTTGHPSQHSGGFALLEVMRFDSNWQKQILTSFATTQQYYRFKNGGIYTPWVSMATTEKIDISFPFDTGYIQSHADYQCRIIKNSLNQGLIICGVKKSDGTDFTASANAYKIGTLPTGFLSKYNSYGNAMAGTALGLYTGNASVTIYGANGVYAYVPTTCKAVFFTIPYEIV